MKRITDADVSMQLVKIQNGDINALSELYDITSRHVYAVCFSYLKNRSDADDATSETYLKAVSNINKFRGRGGFNWLYTIAKNTSLNIIKKRGREIPTDFADEKNVNAMGASCDFGIVLDDESGIVALAQRVLGDAEFRIVILHAVCGLGFQEIAKSDGGIEATVRWRYNNALKKIRKAYGEEK